jgi:DNA-binding NarL/FixJ family response regulator
MARLIIVDDHPAVRLGIGALVAAMSDMEVIGEASTVASAVKLCDSLKPDIVLMDLRLGTENGVNAIRQISDKNSSINILVLTTFDGDEAIHRALEAGAHGYVLKDSDLDEIETAIRAVANGKRYIPTNVAMQLVLKGSRVELTAKENEVLVFLADGLRNKEIALRLGIGEATVRTHVQTIIEKFGCHDRGAAIAVAIARGFLATGRREVGFR